MSTGQIAHLTTATAHSPALPGRLQSGAVVVFDDQSQTALFQSLQHKAATAAGIEALAMRAIETGEADSLDRIASLATGLAAELDQLAALVLQLKAASAA